MDRWRDAPEIRLTLVLLTGSFSLVAAGTAGVAASVLLVVGLVALTALLAAVGWLSREASRASFDPGEFLVDLWLGPALGAVLVLFFLDATPGEVQALGGLLGLVAMANYFLRPVYHLLYGLATRIARG